MTETTQQGTATIEVRAATVHVQEGAVCPLCDDDLVPLHLWGTGYYLGHLEDVHDIDAAECELGGSRFMLCLDCFETLGTDPALFAARWAKVVARQVALLEQTAATWRERAALEWQAVSSAPAQVEGQEALL